MSAGVDRGFLDANVLFSAAYVEGAGLQQLWQLADTELLTSTFALEEAQRNLLAYSPERLARLGQPAGEIEVVSEASQGGDLPADVDLPDKDRPILAAAIAATCTHLLTGDARHFRPLYNQRIEGVLVLTPAQYLRRRQR